MNGSHNHHHSFNHFNHTQNPWNQRPSLSHKDQLKAYESLLLQDMAFEEHHLKRSLPLRDVFLALLSARYRQEKLREKMRRREHLERLQSQLAALRDTMARSS